MFYYIFVLRKVDSYKPENTNIFVEIVTYENITV